MTPQLVAGLAVLTGFLVAIWMRKRSAASSSAAFSWPMAPLFCAPVVYPWYLLWLLPFMRSVSTLPMNVWTITHLLCAPAPLDAWLDWLRMTRSAAPQASADGAE